MLSKKSLKLFTQSSVSPLSDILIDWDFYLSLVCGYARISPRFRLFVDLLFSLQLISP